MYFYPPYLSIHVLHFQCIELHGDRKSNSIQLLDQSKEFFCNSETFSVSFVCIQTERTLTFCTLLPTLLAMYLCVYITSRREKSIYITIDRHTTIIIHLKRLIFCSMEFSVWKSRGSLSLVIHVIIGFSWLLFFLFHHFSFCTSIFVGSSVFYPFLGI